MDLVREHASQHDRAEELPLLTEAARVTDVTALDEDRTDEVRGAVADLLDDVGREDLLDGDSVDWGGLDDRLDGAFPLRERFRHLRDRYRRDYPSLVSVELTAEETPLEFVAGQYLTMRFHDVPRPYSIASAPSEDRIRLCIRRVPGGHLTPALFEHLSPGDEVTIRGPNGEFVLADPSGRDAAFVATGTGVAPIRSMVDHLFEQGWDVHRGERRDVWLFLGASWRDDLPFHDHFRSLAASRENFHYVPTLSRESSLGEWDGETAYVQRALLKHVASDVDASLEGDRATALGADPESDDGARIDPANLEIYACGLNAMVYTLVDVARSVGVPDDLIEAEGYG